ncbi:hypothetical protein BKA69DRAFT_389540 [Paraphysoderma sedebokerense]|nr:hypothetical protein BKA69DRAFT_389540 [Paraphysoderma sedebokerense]
MLSAIRREVSSDALYKAYDVLESANPHEIDLYTDAYQTILDAASSDNVAIRKLAITFVPMFIKLFGPSMQYEAFDRLLDACESPNGPIRTEALAQLLCLCKSDLLTSYKAIDFLGEYICKGFESE